MRVHHIINDYSSRSGGAERLVCDLHAGLVKRDISSVLVGLVSVDDKPPMYSHCLNLESPYELLAIVRLAHYIRTQVEPEDIVHAHLFPVVFYLAVLKHLRILKAALVCTEHGTGNRRRHHWYGKIIDRLVYGSMQKVIAISAGVASELSKWCSAVTKKIVTIENGIHLHHSSFDARPRRDKAIIVSVGHLKSVKNHTSALDAIALLNDLNFEYRIAGSGSCETQLLHQSAELQLDEKVKLLGYVEDIESLLADADIFLMCSTREGFGLAAVEAMNAGLPIVASDIPGLRAVVGIDQCDALPVNPVDPQSIAAALRRLLESAQMREQFGEKAFHRSLEFSLERMVNRHMDLYQGISSA